MMMFVHRAAMAITEENPETGRRERKGVHSSEMSSQGINNIWKHTNEITEGFTQMR